MHTVVQLSLQDTPAFMELDDENEVAFVVRYTMYVYVWPNR